MSQLKSRHPKQASKSLRHQPVGGKSGRPARSHKKRQTEEEVDSENEDVDNIETEGVPERLLKGVRFEDEDDMEDQDEEEEMEEEEGVDGNLYYDEDADYPAGEEEEEVNMHEEETAMQFLSANRQQSLSLADIIMERLREKEAKQNEDLEGSASEGMSSSNGAIPPKVAEVYTAVGSLLQHYRSGKIPKALKMLPHLKGWERILWLTRPDMWSPSGTYAVTRIFASNLHVKMAQRFYNLVLLEKCRDDIQMNQKLNYHLYMSLKKALFKPAAFFKGILLPLAQSGTCTLREALVIGSVLLKVSIPAIHSAAALLRLTEIPYNGAISVLIKIMLQKKYALPLRVIAALCAHFQKFLTETRALPIVWHVSLLTFVQRYKFEFTEEQVEEIYALLRAKGHPDITLEIRRELATRRNQSMQTGSV